MQKEQSDNFQEEAEGLLPLRQQLYDQTFSWPIQRRLNRQCGVHTRLFLNSFSPCSKPTGSATALIIDKAEGGRDLGRVSFLVS